jgi:hypothetical protein
VTGGVAISSRKSAAPQVDRQPLAVLTTVPQPDVAHHIADCTPPAQLKAALGREMLSMSEILRPPNASQAKVGLLFFTSFVFPYLAVLAFFAYVDVYHQHFFEPRFSLPYNAARTIFAAYLAWILYFSGAAILEKSSRAFLNIPLIQRLPLSFFVGAALWTFLMLALGYLSLYYRIIAATLTIAVVVVSYRHLYELVKIVAQRFKARRAHNFMLRNGIDRHHIRRSVTDG